MLEPEAEQFHTLLLGLEHCFEKTSFKGFLRPKPPCKKVQILDI